MTDWAQIFTGLLFDAYVLGTPSEKTGLWQLPIVSTVFNTVVVGSDPNLSGFCYQP